MAVSARFLCTRILEAYSGTPYHAPDPDNPPERQAEVTFEACQYTDEDNIDWSKYTPVGEITMTVTNPDAFNQFVVGQDYHVEFRKVQPNKAR